MLGWRRIFVGKMLCGNILSSGVMKGLSGDQFVEINSCDFVVCCGFALYRIFIAKL